MKALYLLLIIPLVNGENCPKSCICPVNELYCPHPRNYTLNVNYTPEKSVKIQCSTDNPPTAEDMKQLIGTKIGPVEKFHMSLCPFPSSFSDLMGYLGVPATHVLQVSSYSQLNNTLTKAHLEGLGGRGVTELYLNDNNLGNLPEDLFAGVTTLIRLDLKNNHNIQLPNGIFRPLGNLEVLELGANNINFIDPGLFRNLTKLRLLNLWQNRLRDLKRPVFRNLQNLESLDISSNGIVSLPPDIFADLKNLTNINLLGNEFAALPQGLFLSTTKLANFRLMYNKGSLSSLPAGLLSNLTHLKHVDLGFCNLSSLPEDLFRDSTSINFISLEHNALKELPETLFWGNFELTTLKLSGNMLQSLKSGTFSKLRRLKFLDLSDNQLETIDETLFADLRDLTSLNLKSNRIRKIGSHAFSTNNQLELINLSHNMIEHLNSSVHSESLLKSCPGLRDINLANNKINQIYSDWRISMTGLEKLSLQNNSIEHLSIEDLNFISSKITLDLQYNRIAFIDCSQHEIYETSGEKSVLPRIKLLGNPFICSCENYQFVKLLQEKSLQGIVHLDHISSLKCTGPEGLTNEPLNEVDLQSLICKTKTNCPVDCTCFIRPDDSALLVSCANRGIHKVPESLPTETSITLRDGALFSITQIHLDLSQNKISSLPTALPPGYDRVTRLSLSNNTLVSANISILPPSLEVLEVDGNNLTVLDTASMKYLANTALKLTLALGDNPWHCDCVTREFVRFVQSHYLKISDYSNVTCSGGNLLSKLTLSEVCPESEMALAIGLLLALLVGLSIGGIVALYYRYQKEIKVWLYAHQMCLWFVTEEELDKDKIYDAFISYSQKDEDFVVNHLVPGLEDQHPKFKLCLHYRDWIVGDFIPKQIARSVEDSRRTVVVLSPNFIESVWGRMEFRAAHSQALSDGRARVIVILYGDVGPTENLDEELRAYLSTNTYVKWGDPWFWDKLRYALPHPPELSRGIPLLQTNASSRRNHANGINSNGINSPTSNCMIIEPLTTLSSKPD